MGRLGQTQSAQVSSSQSLVAVRRPSSVLKGANMSRRKKFTYVAIITCAIAAVFVIALGVVIAIAGGTQNGHD